MAKHKIVIRRIGDNQHEAFLQGLPETKIKGRDFYHTLGAFIYRTYCELGLDLDIFAYGGSEKYRCKCPELIELNNDSTLCNVCSEIFLKAVLGKRQNQCQFCGEKLTSIDK